MNKKPTKQDSPPRQPSKTKPQNQLNIQNNIFMGNELDALSKLPEPLAHRAMNLLEKTTEHKMQMDKEIIELEKDEQRDRGSNMRWFYALQGLGALSAFIFIVGSLGIFAYLVAQDKPNAWLSLIPAIITSLVKLGNIKNHKN